MDVDLEAPSGGDSDPRVGNGAGAAANDEALIGKIGATSEKEAVGPNGEDLMVEVMGSDVFFDGVFTGNSKSGKEGELRNSGVQAAAGGGSLGQDRSGDVGEGGEESSVDVEEPEAARVAGKEAAHVVHKKPSAVVYSDSLEDMDVDIDDSGHVQTVVPSEHGDASVGASLNKLGNESGTAEDTKKLSSFGTSVNKLENKSEATFEHIDSSPREENSEIDGKMEQVRDGGTVRNTGGESEDEEVDIGGHEPNLFTNQKHITDEVIRSEHTGNVLHTGYQPPAEKEGAFSVSDMVWGKVRSHPWWPGQIFDLSDSSEVAMKHHKKDCYLVAFFGDRTFAWSEASQLKHFRAHFSHVEKQSNSEDVHHAISCALKEVSRRVELGLACHCLQPDVYEKLRYQNVESTGIREEASIREGIDESANVYSFQPNNFLQYIKSLAQAPSNGADQLEIVIAKAQLLAFYRLKGYNHLPEYQFTEWSSKNELDTVTNSSFAEDGQPVENQIDSHLKRKHNTRDVVYTSKRDRSIPELMDENMLLMGEDYDDDGTFSSSLTSPSSTKKQKASDYSHEESSGPSNNQSTFSATSTAPKQSFKIGDCIMRAASQLTGSPNPPSFLKSINEKAQKVNESDGACIDVPIQHENPNVNSSRSVADDMLSQLQSVARDPKKGHSSINNLTSFFSTVRNNTLSPDKADDGQKRKVPRGVMGSPETFEFEDMKDSYWTDRVIQNGGEEKPDRKERKLNYQIVTLEPPASLSRSPKVHSRKRYSNDSHKISVEQPASTIDKSKQDMLPAELILNFPDINSVPSESKLNNMFRRFGPLKEFETEVDRESNRARVVFKRGSDAEVAYSSSQKFNIFGSTIVRYELSYFPSVSYKAARIPASQDMQTAVTLPELEFASAHDLEFITMQELEDATMQDLQYSHPHDLEGVTMQDLEFTTNHDLDFPGSQDLDIVSAPVPEVRTIQSLDVSTRDQHPTIKEVSELPSSEDLEAKAGGTVTDGSGHASQDAHMEIAAAEDQQRANQGPFVEMPEDLEPGGVQETESVAGDLKVDEVQQSEPVQNPESAGGCNCVETTGSEEVYAQEAVTSHGQDAEVTATQDVDTLTTGEEKILRDHDFKSDKLLGQDEDPIENHTNMDVTGSHQPEVSTGDPMSLSNRSAEQEIDRESVTILNIQRAGKESNQDNDTIGTQESEVISREDGPAEVEMLAPDVAKKQDPVEIVTTETMGGMSDAVTKDIAPSDSASIITEDKKEQTADQDDNMEGQVSPSVVTQAPNAAPIYDPSNVEIMGPQTLEYQTEEPCVAGSVVVVETQDDEDVVTTQANEKEKDMRSRVFFKEEDQKAVDCTSTLEDPQEAT